jgi:glycosyltransferase involved in cell wall biosynthesis
MSLGKNVGLFIQAAAVIFKHHPFARFRVIGEGFISAELKSLAVRLAIDHVVDFVGWAVHEELPSVLADLDIVVNPSLRGWAETFCIANMEVMAMEISLVTFAVGGECLPMIQFWLWMVRER